MTIFLTTHRLEEAERLCDRVALLNTSLRAIGRPDDSREQLFARRLVVRTLAPLPEPDHVLALSRLPHPGSDDRPCYRDRVSLTSGLTICYYSSTQPPPASGAPATRSPVVARAASYR